MKSNKPKNSKYIEGIYNYCDRWCERCSFTSRCLNFDISEKKFGDTEKLDINNKEFWDGLSKVFQTTIEMLKEEAERLGIDLDSIDGEEIEKEMMVREEAVKNHNLFLKSKLYADKVDKWFEESGNLFEEKEIELEQAFELDLSGSKPYDDVYELPDIVEIIRWYQYQISAKLNRALHGKFEENEIDLEDFPKDSDGSSKVALIAIDRSIMAWGKMMEQFSDTEEEILDILIFLSKLKNHAEKEFPNARDFIRPGFDTILPKNS